MRNLLRILFMSSLVASLPAHGQGTFGEMLKLLYKNTVPAIQPDSMQQLKTDAIIFDVRSEEEFDVSHIKGANFIDYETFNPETLDSIAKNTPIILYCSVGYRSERIGEQLQEHSFTNITNLYGGIFNWKNQGFPVVNNLNQPTDSVHAYNRIWGIWLENGIKVYE